MAVAAPAVFNQKDYVTPGAPFAFGGRNTVRRHHPFMTRSQVKKTLAEVDSYTRQREPKRPHYNPIFVYEMRALLQADLCELRELAPHNDNIVFLLLVCDTFTRKCWCAPLKDKRGRTVATAFETLLRDIERNGGPAKRCLTDQGNEFLAQPVQQMFARHNIQHNTTTTHASHIERIIRSLELILYMFLTEHETKRYVDHLDDIIRTYNSRRHRMIGMSPDQAELPQNHLAVRRAHEEHYHSVRHKTRGRKQQPQFKVGDYVRVRRSRGKFFRVYDETFSFTVYKVHEVLTNLPHVMYKLVTPDDAIVLDDRYYEAELQLVAGDTYKVDEVLERRTNPRTRRRESLVTWKGWPRSMTTWLPDTAIQRIARPDSIN